MKKSLKAGNVSRISALLALFILAAGLVPCLASGEIVFTEQEQAYINDSGTLTASTIKGGAPLHYIDASGNVRGIAISVLNEVAAVTGLSVEYVLYDTVAEVFASEADIYLGLSKEYSIPGVLFSLPYLSCETILFYRSSLDPGNLTNRIYASVEGGSLPDGINENFVKYYNSREDTIRAVDEGEADYGYGNAYSFSYYALQNGYKNVATIPQGAGERCYSMGVREGDVILLSVLNKGIESLDASRLQALILDVFAQVDRKVTRADVLEMYWREIFLTAMLGVFSTAVFIHLILQANKRLKSDIAAIEERDDRIAYLTYHDKLTGLYNRTYLDEAIKELEESNQVPVSVLMGDVDGLKLINDVLGHEEGDRLLIRVADILRAYTRKDDIIGRQGGDEFIVIMPKTTLEDVANVHREIIKASEWQCRSILPIGLSLGYAVKSKRKYTIRKALGDAESMMYAQKLISTRDRRDIIATNLEEHLQAYDADATQHGLRVAEILQAMGRKLNLMDKEIDDLRLLARMHDIGKMVVEEASSSHRGGLDEKAYRQIRSYPEMGYRIAISSKTLFGIAEHILYQNEWWNGNGYPQGLQGEDIPLASRMLAVVNTFDVMTSGRPYRDPISREDAFEELRKCKGTQFDPYLVDMVISIIPEISVHSSEDD